MPGGVPEANIWRDSEGRVCAFLSRSSGDLGICFPNFASYFFAKGEASQECIRIVVEPAAGTARVQVIDQLKRNVVPLLLQSRGIQVLHASAISFKDGVLGLCGNSFSGKSTLAYALGKRGYEIWTDDSLLISEVHPDVLTLRVPLVTEPRLRPDSRKYFGEIERAPLTTTVDVDEFEISLSEPNEAPLKALFLIHRSSEKKQGALWHCNRIRGYPAFKQVLSLASYYDLAESTERHRIAEKCLNVARKVPVYECHYPNGFGFLKDVVDQIESFLSGFRQ